MGWITLLKAGIKRQRRNIACITTLFFLIALSLNTALTVLVNSKSYISSEMDRLGYGDTTAWAGSEEAAMRLAGETGSAKVQPLIFAGYAINGKRSDNEGQLLAHDPERYPYRFLNDSLDGYREGGPMEPGEIYISPSMKSTFQAEIGDEVVFSLSRGSEQAVFTIKGYFEDPFMGSSMIDMKSFLIGEKDFEILLDTLGQISDFNILARSGAMVHLSQTKEDGFSQDGLSGLSGRKTSLLTDADFTYSKQSVLGFMMIQQNIFTGFLGAFAAVLLAVSAIVIGNSISGAIRQESGDLGILKTMGCTGSGLRSMQMTRYGLGIAGGMVLALGCSGAAGRAMSALTVTSSGLLIPHRLPLGSACRYLPFSCWHFFFLSALKHPWSQRSLLCRPSWGMRRGFPPGRPTPSPWIKRGWYYALRSGCLSPGRGSMRGPVRFLSCWRFLFQRREGSIPGWGRRGKGL